MKKVFLFLTVCLVSSNAFAKFNGVIKTSCGKFVNFHSAASGQDLVDQIKLVNMVVCPQDGTNLTVTFY